MNFGVIFFSNTKLLIFWNFYFIVRKSLNSFNVRHEIVIVSYENNDYNVADSDAGSYVLYSTDKIDFSTGVYEITDIKK